MTLSYPDSTALIDLPLYSNLFSLRSPATFLTADAVVRARASWASDVADVLLTVILSPSNSQRSRQTAIGAVELLGQQLDVHVGVWLAPVLQNMSPPLLACRIIPVRVSQSWWQAYCIHCGSTGSSVASLTAQKRMLRWQYALMCPL